jgi:hypothetical protein
VKHALLPNVANVASVVSLRHRYVLVVNSKTAGTTLKTIAADLEREPLAARGLNLREDRAQRQENWLTTPTLADLSADALREVFLGGSFFRFTTVRHPFSRCWSAWIDKVIGGHPEFVGRFAREGWFPAELSDPASLIEAFERFVWALDERVGLVGSDRHWAPQHLVLQWGAFPYDFVGKTEHFDEVLSRWEEFTGLPVRASSRKIGKRNVRGLSFPGGLLSEETWSRLLSLYRLDLAAFDYAPNRDLWQVDRSEWDAAACRLLQQQCTAPVRAGNRSRVGDAWRQLRIQGSRGSRRLSARRSPPGRG